MTCGVNLGRSRLPTSISAPRASTLAIATEIGRWKVWGMKSLLPFDASSSWARMRAMAPSGVSAGSSG